MNFSFYEILQTLRNYLIAVLIFIVASYLIKGIETFQVCRYQDSISLLAILQSFFNITSVFCLYSIIILPIYLLISRWKQKVAQILVALLFALLISLEIGLLIFYNLAGVMMGAELIARPFAEIFTTIRNSSNLILDICSIVVVIIIFIATPFFAKKLPVFHRFVSQIAGIITIVFFSVCTLYYQQSDDKIMNTYLESKSFYFFSAVKDYYTYKSETGFVFDNIGNVEKIEMNEKMLKDYLSFFPNRTILDLYYPLERPSSEIPDVLSPFFHKFEKDPNIVIVIVESLGSFLMGEKEKGVSFTPFLDSLAKTGLYWQNCLATTPRTYGVVPAIVGSVPHGKRGFQFGVMPNHHSLFTVLKNNNYAVNFFYGGDPNFDSMLDFLTIQDPDHIDNFHTQIRNYQKKDLANWWALYDHVLFEESFKELKKQGGKRPNVNVYLTLTTHDPFSGGDKQLKKIYEPKIEKLFSKLRTTLGKQFLPAKDLFMTVNYLDDSMRDFFYQYSQLPGFENTIFIITGDHAHGIYKNDLAHFNVPLIIWSPLLKTPRTFSNIVSHWAITPSVISFLQNNYDLKTPKLIAWCSNGLDTTSYFNPSEKVLFLSYERKVNAMVFNEYFFQNSEKKLFKIDKNLNLIQIEDPMLIEEVNSKFNTLKYVNNYVYHNDKLIKNEKKSYDNYIIFQKYENKKTIVCSNPDTIPSIAGVNTFDIMPVKIIKVDCEKIIIRLTTDIVIHDYLYQDQQMRLVIKFSGKNFEYISKEYITKYIEDDEIVCNKKYELSIEKDIDIGNLDKISAHIYVVTNEKDGNWRSNKKITLSNINIMILGKKRALSTPDILERKNYSDFFIAHAGGNIDGKNYTNCVEALDFSYKNGCRLFELDLLKTSDGKIVAVHDWETFKTISNYPGTIDDTPLTEKEFLSRKIHEKYTPMNMNAINSWFEKHPDAILVTDKINDPERIYKEFHFRDRVIMELFTWNAVDKAIELGIKPLVSNFLYYDTPNFEQVFDNKKIEYCNTGRYQISGNEDMLRRLKVKGIKNFVFGLDNPIKGVPAEKYVWANEMDMFYGMYARNFELLDSLSNGK
ncbi:MAG: sulfatase-like hydrolase/transferase [Bacteroidales bacterium]|jgi:phosphoglycerol transferase MdoB-like AlkP superfamily enzyme|nr:sulfatase-like hydrolase/transferase [Bacteroidales bacterium]